MASYRPKSLAELNNIYDKSRACEQEIKKNETNLARACEKDSVRPLHAGEETQAERELPRENGELSEDIARFMESFGRYEDKPVEAMEPVPSPIPLPVTRTVVSAPKVKPPKTEQEKQPEPEREQSAPSAERTEVLVAAEKDELFSEYMSIMSDEEEESFLPKNRSRKRKKSRQEPEPETESAAEPVYEPEPYDFPEQTDTAEQEYTESEEPVQVIHKTAAPPKKKHLGLQLFLIIVLLITLLSALAVTGAQVIFKNNTGLAFDGERYMFSATEDFNPGEIKKGDMVITRKGNLEQGDAFVYYDFDLQDYSFAVKQGNLGSDYTAAEANHGDVTVLNTNLRGKVSTVIPFAGAVFGFTGEHFMPIVIGLMLLALALILVLALCFRSREETEAEPRVKSRKKQSSIHEGFGFDEEAEQEDFAEIE